MLQSAWSSGLINRALKATTPTAFTAVRPLRTFGHSPSVAAAASYARRVGVRMDASRGVATATADKPTKAFPGAGDFLPLEGFEHMEIYCSNAKQAAHWYQSVMGFQPLAYSGLETGVKDKTSYVLRQGNMTLVLTSSLVPNSHIDKFVSSHGDGVKTIALRVPDARQAFAETTKRGAPAHMEPTEVSDANGTVVMSGIQTYGDVVHVFIERKNYNGLFLPGFQPWSPPFRAPPVGLERIDHIVGNVDWGQMDKWCKYYEDVMGFTNLISFDDKDISTEYTALMSKVMTSGTGYVKFPINEPAKGKKKSQIEEYLDFNNGAGAQHVAIATKDIISTVSQMRQRGCEFLYVPGTYYDTVTDRCGQIDEDLEALKQQGILVDRDEDGYLLQIFTKPVCDRPTLFFEIIQRKGAQSFGKGNFKALFESIEEEQRRRGTL
ncbi:unnamed protein product [Vitrella brassicaformis CCMP3155]|uniref:4-hydroxyphenylpyruvate dioxygenase n=2 Tax=Vitrella brassicaformis TaxID=1169539 RepID=A0A0G4F1A6_VITBC|nr:unnamed protein product [Vitrella brassicaformis CCMP3155]|mmetsp:Transcript_23143/g.66311  ORF Transcript_23143/g.66311 Transcript_23143/m.66311 type:complete len:436 (+) Transcript_23143:2818-4125(+)|eukprot:CEM05158.1 unnamed protein product [Vitrella brassicaformis CCMP3155]